MSGPKGVGGLLQPCAELRSVVSGDRRLANPFAGGDHALAWKSLAQQESRFRRSLRSPRPTLSANPLLFESSSGAHRLLLALFEMSTVIAAGRWTQCVNASRDRRL